MPSEPGAHHHHAGDDASLAELLDLGAEALHANLVEVTTWIADLTAGDPPTRILDLGAGTGAGTIALLAQFPAATVTAIDSSEEMLHRIHRKAADAGLGERVHPVLADLDLSWPDAPAADLVWASDSLHHAADPDATLRRAFESLRPGGLMAVLEPENFPSFLPGELGIGRPGLENRLRELVSARRSATHPKLGTDWGPRLVVAGFDIVDRRRFDIDLTPPLDAAGRRYARATLLRDRDRVLDQLDADDRAAWATLLDESGPEWIGARSDLDLRASRSAWIARRP